VPSEDPGHPGPDDSVERQGAEQQLANVADLFLFLVEVSLPTSLSTYLYDTIMAWATEAVAHAGKPQERQAADRDGHARELKRLIDLAYQDNQLRVDLGDAMAAVEAAARQLAALGPDSRAWDLAWSHLAQAISRLRNASANLMVHDAAIRAAATEPTGAIREAHREFLSTFREAAQAPDVAPTPRIGPEGTRTRAALGGWAAENNRDASNAQGTLTRLHLERLAERVEGDRIQLGRPVDPAPGQGGVAPTSPPL
jgi:hypothetical protein